MTIGIMSMQRIYNYGSSLQAYALRRLVEDISGVERVGFLDYAPGEPLNSAAAIPINRAVRAIEKARTYASGAYSIKDKASFIRHKMRYARDYHPMIGVNRERDSRTDVSLQVIGSDEVFNCIQSNTKVGFAPDLFGLGSKAGSLASYAASFGNTTLRDIDERGIRETLVSGLDRFSSISVRDWNSAEVVANLLGTDAPPIHLDPTLVYDLMSLKSRVPLQRLLPYRYMIVYGYSGRLTDAENSAVRRYAYKEDLRVIALGGLQECADLFIDCDPFTLLAYFRDAEAVVTDTFHGTIFSVLNRLPFVSIIRKSRNGEYGNEEKLGYLLEKLALTDRQVSSADDIRNMMSATIDYSSVSKSITREAERSRDYLAQVCLNAEVGTFRR